MAGPGPSAHRPGLAVALCNRRRGLPVADLPLHGFYSYPLSHSPLLRVKLRRSWDRAAMVGREIRIALRLERIYHEHGVVVWRFSHIMDRDDSFTKCRLGDRCGFPREAVCRKGGSGF